jgi:hypothetical protein
VPQFDSSNDVILSGAKDLSQDEGARCFGLSDQSFDREVSAPPGRDPVRDDSWGIGGGALKEDNASLSSANRTDSSRGELANIRNATETVTLLFWDKRTAQRAVPTFLTAIRQLLASLALSN